MRFAVLALLVFTACATPRGEGRLVQRLAPAKREKWPTPVPLGEPAGIELTQGALSDEEAARLPAVCMDAVRAKLGPTRPAKAPEWRVVISQLVVDTRRDARGDRMVRVRAVVEVRREKRPLASANGLAFLTSGTPSFRSDGVEPREVEKTVREACTQAITALTAPSPPLDAQEREQLRARTQHADPKERAEAIHLVGERLSEEDSDLVMAALADGDAQVRRFAAWSLGELCETRAIETLANMAELDEEYAVRFEAVVALNKMIASDTALAARVRTAREAAIAQRLHREAPVEEPAPPEEEGESRVLDLP